MSIFDMFREIAERYPESERAQVDSVTLDQPKVCDVCRERWTGPGPTCEQCQIDRERGYSVLTLAGRCANGAERDSGTRWHALPTDSWKALCGAKPGRHSAGWSSWKIKGQEVTCPRCLAKLDRKAKSEVANG